MAAMILTVIGAVCGFIAAGYWLKSAWAQPKPWWSGQNEIYLPKDSIGFTVGMVPALAESMQRASQLSATAAIWTAVAVVINAAASIAALFGG